MTKLVKLYEFSVFLVAICVCIFTFGTIWYGLVEGEKVNPPLVYNNPHQYKIPVSQHIEQAINNGTTHLTTKLKYHRGEMVQAYVDVIKYIDSSETIQWQLMNGQLHPYDKRERVFPKGHTHQVVDVERIPKKIPLGQYHFSGIDTVDIVFGKKVKVPVRTNCFQVVD